MSTPAARARPAPRPESTRRQFAGDRFGFGRSIPMPPDYTLWEQIKEKTGRVMLPNQYEDWERRKENEHHEILRVLRALGLRGSRHSKSAVAEADKLWVVGLMNGHTDPLLRTPRWNCLPWIARAQRRELMLNATFYLYHRPNCRHIRVTHGQRVPLTQLGETVKSLSKLISRLNSRDWFSQQAEIVLRCVESTWNGATAHVHAHLILRPLVDLAEPDWIELSGRIRQHFDADVGELSSLGDVNRAVPYFAKSSDLAVFSGDELRTYIQQLRRLRTHEPMGEFREFCRDLDTTKTKLVRRGHCIVRVARSDGLRRSSGTKPDRGGATGGRQIRPKPAPRNQVLRMGPARPHGSAIAEPTLLVRNFDGNHDELLKANPDIRNIRDQLMPQWPRASRSQPALSIVPSTVQLIDQTAVPSSSSPSASTSSPKTRHAKHHNPPCSSTPAGGDSAMASPPPYSPFLRSKPAGEPSRQPDDDCP